MRGHKILLLDYVGDMAVQVAPMALLFRAGPVAVDGCNAFWAHGHWALAWWRWQNGHKGPLGFDTRSSSGHRRSSRRLSRQLPPLRSSPRRSSPRFSAGEDISVRIQ